MPQSAVTLFNLPLFVYGDHTHTWGYAHTIGGASVVVPGLHKKHVLELCFYVF